jgi:FKBP-type peptidyl-prolyl cis-trans isomerase SlyD
MQIAKNTVVTLSYTMSDSDGNELEKSEEPLTYLHGGYENIFPEIESALMGKVAGDSIDLTLEPADAFGEYDPNLVRMEPQDAFPSEVEIGMRFEGQAEESGEMVLYTVTDVADGKVVVDGNHPLAGERIRFAGTIEGVRAASKEEVEHGHVHGAGGHHHH